jgi:hypothetical protein
MAKGRKAKAKGRKANLSPRVPAARMLPKLGKWAEQELPGGKKRRVLVEHQDFATPAVVAALVAGGWKRPVFNPAVDAVNWALHNLSNEIYHEVTHYLSAAHYQQPPKEFRREAEAFHKVLKACAAGFPGAGKGLAEALNLELEKLDHDDAPDIELCRTVILALLAASRRIQADEAGAGKDADRAKHEFFKGLAKIYEDYTGRRPAQVPAEDDPFSDFVAAVNKRLPVPFRLSGIIHLVRSYLRAELATRKG